MHNEDDWSCFTHYNKIDLAGFSNTPRTAAPRYSTDTWNPIGTNHCNSPRPEINFICPYSAAPHEEHSYSLEYHIFVC